MTSLTKKTLVWLLVLTLCLAPMGGLAEETLLSGRMAEALAQGRQIETSLRLSVDDGLLMALLPPAEQAAIRSLLENTEIALRYAGNETDAWTCGFALVMFGTEILSGAAEITESGVAVVTNALPGKTLFIPFEMMTSMVGEASVDAASLEALSSALEVYAGAALMWVYTQEGLLSYDDTPHDGASTSVHLRLTGEQLKSLIQALADASAADETLLPTLLGGLSGAEIAEALRAEAEALAPTGVDWSIDAYLDDLGSLIRAEGSFPALFEGADAGGDFTYTFTQETDKDSYALAGSLTWEDGGNASLSVSQTIQDALNVHSEDFQLEVLVQPTSDEPSQRFALGNLATRSSQGSRETTTGDFTLTLEQVQGQESSAAQTMDEMPLWMQTILPGAQFTLQIQSRGLTTLVGPSDFRSATEATLFLGDPLITLYVDSYSTERTVFPNDNEWVDLSAMDEEQSVTLLSELQAGLLQALFSVMSVLPPELMAYLNEGG